MSVGRYFCVALPFLLAVASIVCMLIAGLTGITSTNLYMFRIDVSNLTIDASALTNLSGAANDQLEQLNNINSRSHESSLNWHDESAVQGLNSNTNASSLLSNLDSLERLNGLTARDLGLAKVYDVNLWGYCATYQDDAHNCTRPQFNWAQGRMSQDGNLLAPLQNIPGANNTAIPAIVDGLRVFEQLNKWTEVVYIIAMIALALEVAIGLFTACSRAVSCVTWLISGLAATLVVGAAAMMTVMASAAVGTVETFGSTQGAHGNLHMGFLSVAWLGSAFAIAASSFWLFTICCCKPENRPYQKKSRYSGEHEKLVPTGSYQPIGEPQQKSYNFAPLGRLRREHILNPVTALAFYTSGNGRRCVLAGEDTDINVYDVASARLLGRLPVFRAQPIHGITVPPLPPRGRDASATAAATSPRNPPRSILVWGGHSVAVIPGAFVEAIVCADPVRHEASVAAESPPVEDVKAPDWILDGAASPFTGDEDRVVLLTAHNELVEAHASGDGATIAFGRVRSPSRPILYSGNLAWAAEDRVLVAAGTVFGEILVWKCRPGGSEPGEGEGEGPGSGCEILFVFAGHEGSIFGVHISPEMTRTASGDAVRLLASCSDDRTIRVWDITEGGEGSRTYDQRISDTRETGFGDSAGAVADDDSSARCLAVAMAHLSRIWHVEFPQEQRLFPSDDIVQIYSFGEDSTAQKWHLCFDTQQLQSPRPEGSARDYVKPTAKLVHQSTHSNHSGKHIWSRAIHSSEGEVLVATGGSDGKVALIQGSPTMPLPDKAATQPKSPSTLSNTGRIISFTLADVSRACLPPHTTEDANPIQTGNGGDKDATHTDSESRPLYKRKNAREGFQRYAFITERRILMVTNHGKLFLGTFNEEDEQLELEWAELPLPGEISQTLLSYSVLGSSRAKPLAFIGTTAGDVYCYDDDAAADRRLSLRPVANVGGKVVDIFCVSDADHPSNKPLQDSSADMSNGHSTEHSVELLVTVLGAPRAVIIRLDSRLSASQSEVTLEKGFQVTGAAFYQGYLLLGSRTGAISVLGQDATGGYSPRLTVKVKLGDAVTSIVPLPTRSDQAPGCFLATCRDGKYRIYELRTTDGTVELNILHEATPRFVSLIEGAWFSDNGGGGKDLMLCGFRGKSMVLWNETTRREIASVDCGGAHRSFACTRLSANPEGFRFVYTKASQMHIFSQTDAPQKTLKPGGHGREIKAISASPDGRYIATGAEDTAIRIWEYYYSSSSDDDDAFPSARRRGDFRCVAVLERHSAGIQTLKWHGNEYLFSSAGNEEFYAWRINRIDSDACPLGTVCEAVFPDRSEGGDLRITDFDVERTTTTTIGYESSPEHGEPAFYITMALSNSTLQSYAYTRRGGFSLRGRRSYTGACLTQLRHLGTVDRGGPGVLAAATDGHLAVYGNVTSPSGQNGETEEGFRDVSVTKLHQNSVKSLDMRKVESDGEATYLVVTGGDDNALGVTHLRFNATEARYEFRGKSIVRSAHAAAITGIAILRMVNHDRDAIVVSTSNDQRVKTWKLAGWQSAGLRIVLLDDRYSSVADSGDLAVLDENRFAVAGAGMEVWSLP
ncbi:hypothetical protein DL771_012108 [Monosporascus sp. 5C6A]|nr:hypothetical protein DL771_012108 [Monosporascus sp. 5C6A]